MEDDRQADVTHQADQGPLAPRPSCIHWDTEIISLGIGRDKITSRYKSQLATLQNITEGKESWAAMVFDTINWDSCGLAFHRLSKNRQVNVTKACHHYWRTGAKHSLFHGKQHP
jgi:hypothetical protein